jgi:hypothetical protein
MLRVTYLPGRLAILSLAVLAWFALPAAAQQRPTEEQILKARDDVRRLAVDLDRIYDQFLETRRRLEQAQTRLDDLEGRPYYGRSSFDWRDWGRGFGSGMGRSTDRFRGPFGPPAAPPAARGSADVERQIDRLMRELEDLRRELRR